MVSNPELITFSSRDIMAARVADLIAAAAVSDPLADLVGEIAVSGGSTPKALYDNLATRQLPWNRIRLTLVDERWVPLDHERSNEAFVREAFSETGCEIVGLYNGAISAREGALKIGERLDARQKQFDAVILGMGDDGHTASWFPHAEGLGDALNSEGWICAITAKKSGVTGEETERLTLTLSAIKDSRFIILLITGESKRAIFEKALEPGAIENMPVRAILRARPDIWVCWAP